MKKNYLLSIVALLLLMSCDTNDNNDPAQSCDADFISLTTSSIDPSQTNFGFYKYPKSNTLSTPVSLNSGNTFLTTNSRLSLAKSTIDNIHNRLTYYFPYINELITYDINNNTVSQATIPGVSTPEYLNGNLYFLQETNAVSSTFNTLSADFTIIDENLSIVNPSTSIDFTGSGYFNASYLLSTSNEMDKIYFLANSKLIIYDHSTGSWSDYLLETFDATTNRIYYIGVEYVDANTLLALRGNVMANKLELIKIDLSSTTPSISVEKDLSGDLSIPSLDIINGHDSISTSFDSCDNSFYFVYNSTGSNIRSIVFEIKLNSNTIYEYPQNTSLLLGFDIKD